MILFGHHSKIKLPQEMYVMFTLACHLPMFQHLVHVIREQSKAAPVISITLERGLARLHYKTHKLAELGVNVWSGDYQVWTRTRAGKWSAILNHCTSPTDLVDAVRHVLAEATVEQSVHALVDGVRGLVGEHYTLEAQESGYLLYVQHSTSSTTHDGASQPTNYYVAIHLIVERDALTQSMKVKLKHAVCCMMGYGRLSAQAFAAAGAMPHLAVKPCEEGPFPGHWSDELCVSTDATPGEYGRYVEQALLLARSGVLRHRLCEAMIAAVKTKTITALGEFETSHPLPLALRFVLPLRTHKALKGLCSKFGTTTADGEGVLCTLTIVSGSAWYVDVGFGIPKSVGQSPSTVRPLRLSYGAGRQVCQDAGRRLVVIRRHGNARHTGFHSFLRDIDAICSVAKLWLPLCSTVAPAEDTTGWPGCIHIEPRRVVMMVQGVSGRHICAVCAATALPRTGNASADPVAVASMSMGGLNLDSSALVVQLGVARDLQFVRRLEQVLSADILQHMNLRVLWQLLQRLVTLVQITYRMSSEKGLAVIVRSPSSLRIALAPRTVVEVECSSGHADGDADSAEAQVLVRLVKDEFYPKRGNGEVARTIESALRRAAFSNKPIDRGPRFRNYITRSLSELPAFLEELSAKANLRKSKRKSRKKK